VNTPRVTTAQKQMQHKEGGWDRGIDFTDANIVKKQRKKMEK